MPGGGAGENLTVPSMMRPETIVLSRTICCLDFSVMNLCGECVVSVARILNFDEGITAARDDMLISPVSYRRITEAACQSPDKILLADG